MVRYINIILFLIISMGGLVIGYLIFLLIKLQKNKEISKHCLDFSTINSNYSSNEITVDECTQLIYPETYNNIPIARLNFIEIEGKPSQRIEFIYKNQISLGRSKDADLPITDKTVSSIHAFIIYKNSKLYLKDEGSTNGTFCNGLKITEEYPVNLSQKNIIKIGRTKFTIESL